MKKRSNALMYAAIAFCATLPALTAAEAKVYFQENFQNYANMAPGVTADKGITVGNEPIWANSADLNIRTKSPSVMVYAKDIAVPDLNKLNFRFGYRFMNDAGKFEVVFKTADNKDVIIAFDHNGIKIGAAEYKLPVAMPNWNWRECVISMDGNNLKVFRTFDRSFKEVLSVPFKQKIKGINFKGFEKADFAINSLLLTDLAPVKGYPVEKHFAAFNSLKQMDADARSAAPGETVKIDLNKDSGIRMQIGSGATLILTGADGKTQNIEIAAGGITHNLVVPALDKKKGDKVDLADAVIRMGTNGAFATQYVRPNLRRYVSSYDAEKQYFDILRDWDKLPKASEHPLDIDLISTPTGTMFYLDGSFIKKLDNPISAAAVQFKGNSKYVVKAKSPNTNNNFYVLDFKANPRAKAFADAKISLKPGYQLINGIPMDIADGMNSADVGIAKQGKGNWGLEVEEYHARTPLDGFPSAIHYRVPAAPYSTAYVVCAIDPDQQKDKVLVTRLGHYVENGSGGNMLGDTDIEIFGDKIPDNFKEIGSVELNGKKLPLYQVTIPLNTGKILDLASRKSYLDFEFIGKRWENFEQLDNTMKPDPNSDSAFQIFGVTLEKSPVAMDMKQEQPANVFTKDEKASTNVVLTALEPSDGEVKWEAIDVDGKVAFSGSKKYSLKNAGESLTVNIPLKAEVGYYDLPITLVDKSGKVLFNHPARFAIMPQSGRKADQFKTPYGTWWFGGTHGSVGDVEFAGPLLQKAGISKISWVDPKPEEIKKYNISSKMMYNFPLSPRNIGPDGKFSEKDMDEAKKKIDSWLKRYPESNILMIWHETAPGYGIPEELLGWEVPAANDANAAAYEKKLADFINASGEFIRKNYPNQKIQIGNSSASIGAVTRPLRAGAKAEYYDYIGIETPSQVIVPEKLQEVGFQGMLIAKDIGKKLSGKDLKLNGSWEFVYRCERDMGELQQAEWYMRDILISLAHDFPLIAPGIFIDCSNGYYNGLWGGSGILQRGPYAYPKQAYVAYGVLTSVLDDVKFSRQIPTGSSTVYALEFKRADGKYVTALWASRGEVKFELTGKGMDKAIDMFGRETKLDSGKAVVNGGTSPVYVVSSSPVQSVAIIGRGFAKDAARAAKAKVASPMDKLELFEVVPDKSMESTHNGFLPILKPSDFVVSQVKDDEKGECIEVALDVNKNKDMSKYITEYTTLRFKNPVAVPGNPEAVGVWVKGNSNWGQIRFEIEDANGEVFKNLSTGRDWGCDIMDWPGNLSVNFDGWNYVAQPLFKTELFNDHSPGPVSEQWVSEGGDKKIDLPIKVRAITVGMNRTKLDLLDFKPAAPSIRLKDVGGIEK